MHQKIIVLLDLNYTLAKKCGLNVGNWTYDVTKDEYSQELVDILSDKNKYEVHLITARPERYQKATLAKLKLDTGFVPEVLAFKPNTKKFMKVHDYKAEYLEYLLSREIDPIALDNIISIESNAKTRKRYKDVGLVEQYTRDTFLKKYG